MSGADSGAANLLASTQKKREWLDGQTGWRALGVKRSALDLLRSAVSKLRKKVSKLTTVYCVIVCSPAVVFAFSDGAADSMWWSQAANTKLKE